MAESKIEYKSPFNEKVFSAMKLMLDELNNNSGQSWVIIDGVEYTTDWGYAIEGIELFIKALEKKYTIC